MSIEENFTWDYLKNVADALDSYRIRALIDAKQDILDAGIYDEFQYETILFKMLDEEKLKFSLLNFLKQNSESNLKTLEQFSEINSIEINKTLSFLELLKIEKLVSSEDLFDKIEGEENNPEQLIFKDFLIKPNEVQISHLKPIYEPVKVIFETKNCSGCGLCAGICPVNCLRIYNGFGKIDEDKCIRCGLCYFVCPRTYLPTRVLNMTQEGTLHELK